MLMHIIKLTLFDVHLISSIHVFVTIIQNKVGFFFKTVDCIKFHANV